MDVTASTSKDSTIAKFLSFDEDKTNEEQTDNYKVQNKFDLPPEFDENDSRWTLKYREPGPGLVELIEHYGVYVNADKLAECEIWSSGSKTFARMLLTEIFTSNALSTCSWTSESTNNPDIHGGQARPVLNEHAKDIFMKYVVKYGQIQDWDRTDFQCIMKGIRQTMLEMRRKRQKAEQVGEIVIPDKPLKEKGIHKRQIVFPPEYDRSNSRWTLKYREYAQGLFELVGDSCVYVELGLLAKCKSSVNDCVTLARMLLNGIFTKSALSTCSWNGPTSEDSDHNDTKERPGLDENGKLTLLKFVSKYALDNDWEVTDKNIIEKKIRQKMELLRRVARKEEEAGDADERRKKILRQGLDPPPEYRPVDCETNTRWTLKYREPAPGLVELLEDSGVYVNADKLAEYKENSNDCVTLVQRLLTEVFSTKALHICTLSKKNYEFYNILYRRDTSAYLLRLQPRPELDAYAEIVLLNFVDEYALEKGWTVSSFLFIRKSMMHTLNEIREAYLINARERRLAAFHDRVENPAPPVPLVEQPVTNIIGPRNPRWRAFYMKEYNLPK